MARGGNRGGKSRGPNKSSKSFNNKKNYHKKSAYKKPNRYLMVKKQIERNKESEDILKRQQLGKFNIYFSFNPRIIFC